MTSPKNTQPNQGTFKAKALREMENDLKSKHQKFNSKAEPLEPDLEIKMGAPFKIFYGLFFIALLLFMFEFSARYQGGAGGGSGGGDIHGAWAYTQIFVSQQLKNPSSAEFRFGGYRDVSNLGNHLYHVESYVDAQNGFGGTVRQNFVCEIQRIDGGWELRKFHFRN